MHDYYHHQYNKKIHQATIAVMLLGIILSFIQFICNRSLWFDESLLSLNIITKNYSELINPLEYNQVAPIGFLEIEKLFSTLLPNSEFGLRIFPLLCYWVSIYLFYRVIGYISKDGKTILLAVSLFCLNSSLLYYSSEVKQYMCDVFVCLLLYYLFLKKYQNKKMLLLSIVGSLCIFLSNISIIILFTIAIVIIRDGITQNKTNLKRLVLPLTTWALSFGYYYYRFINNHPNKKSMLNYWGESFMPINVFKISFWDFCFYKTKMIFFSLLSFDSAGIIALVFFTIGLYNLIKAKNKNILFLFLLPILLQLILSIFKLYPFDLRLILYQTGFYILILSVGIIDITTWGFQKIKKGWIAWIPIIFPLMVCINLFKNYPIKVEELKNSVEFISNHIQPNETIYIYYGAIPAYKYYTETKIISLKNPILFGKVSREDENKYIKEIENNKNKCWIIFSHIYDTENKYITNYFDLTYKKIFSYTTIGSEVYLYDMTEIKKNY